MVRDGLHDLYLPQQTDSQQPCGIADTLASTAKDGAPACMLHSKLHGCLPPQSGEAFCKVLACLASLETLCNEVPLARVGLTSNLIKYLIS